MYVYFKAHSNKMKALMQVKAQKCNVLTTFVYEEHFTMVEQHLGACEGIHAATVHTTGSMSGLVLHSTLALHA